MSSVVITGAQWGDEGKGKIVDALAGRSDFTVRFQGGDNAGHTVYAGSRKYVFHILPSGILRPGVMCVIGGGVALNLERLALEIAETGLSEKEALRRLRISHEAHLILPCHPLVDKRNEAARSGAKIGTTQRGIGPTYADRAARVGVRMGDTLDKSRFMNQLALCLGTKRGQLSRKDYAAACDVKKMASAVLGLASRFSDIVCDVSLLLDEARRKNRNILYEGAQGTMLDVMAGTYPYVTSSHTLAGGVCVGTGVGPCAIDEIYGVAKAYTTRVGEGPFPTELRDATGERLREIGGEYGATTGRPRRCGWLDIVQLRRAVRLNGYNGLALTKLDVLDSFERIGVCFSYRLKRGSVSEWPINPAEIESAEPEYEFLPGWTADSSGVRSFGDLPKNARKYVRAIEAALGVPVVIVSAGRGRRDMIERRRIFS